MSRDPERAVVFGLDAERYDRTRPSYPDALVDELVADAPLDVLDVGCGTGKASRLFAARGCAVLGVEPDARMAVVARGHGLDVEVGRFEEWDSRGRQFDLVISAQAWHWVDQATGPPKAASILRPGCRLAVFANLMRHAPPIEEAFDDVYARLGSEISRAGSLALGTADERTGATFMTAIEATGLFGAPTHDTYEWSQRYTTAEWLDLLPTHSDHSLLSPERLRALLDAVADAIEDAGGSLHVLYTTHLISARRV